MFTLPSTFIIVAICPKQTSDPIQILTLLLIANLMVSSIALTFANEKAGFPKSSVCPLPPLCIAHSWCLAPSQSSLLVLCHLVFGHQLKATASFPSVFPDSDRHPEEQKQKTATHKALPVRWQTGTEEKQECSIVYYFLINKIKSEQTMCF